MRPAYFFLPFFLTLTGVSAHAVEVYLVRGDVARGESLATSSCLACHGNDSMRMGDPAFEIPRLAGQNASYLLSALRAYRSGERKSDFMTPMAAPLSEQDMRDLSAYFASRKTLTRPGQRPDGTMVRVELHPPKIVLEVCAACHGESGLGLVPEMAVIAGQHRSYVVHALNAYRDGSRANAIMPVFARKLTESDIATLADYFSKQDGVATPARAP